MTEAQELTPKQQERMSAKAFKLEQSIIKNKNAAEQAIWDLARDLYEFHELGGWSHLGHDTLNEFLGQPDLGISRPKFFRLTQMWRDLVEVRKVAPARLRMLEVSKVQEVMPAIMRGDSKPDKALKDAEKLSKSDLRTKYAPSKAKLIEEKLNGRKAPPTNLDEEKLDATKEPEIVECPTCGSRVPSNRIDERSSNGRGAAASDG